MDASDRSPAPSGSSAAVVGFSSIGHLYNHLFEPMYFVVALVLPGVLGVPYEEVLTLIIAGKVMTGLFAPLTGWIADRWSALGMMAIYFLGFGAAAVAVGLSSTPLQITIALAVMGAVGSIYHPVGIAWMVMNSENRGRALGFNGMFGGMGPALAGIVAGTLLEWWTWRAVFIIPGVVVMLTGALFIRAWRAGKFADVKISHAPDPVLGKSDAVKVYIRLTLVMLAGAVMYNVAQSSLPKLFEERLHGVLGEGTSGIGTAVMLAYACGGVFQIVTGHLADRYPLKWTYALFIVLQAPVVLWAATATGLPLVAAAVLMVTCNIGALPAENSLLARYTPGRWQATAYGLKFIVTMCFSALGIYLTARVKETTGSFEALYAAMAAVMVLAALVATTLPAARQAEKGGDGREPVPAE